MRSAIQPLTLMLQILAETATTKEQIRRRGERAINVGQVIAPKRAQGQCIHKCRLDRNCDLCDRKVCRHGVNLFVSCPHCAAESDFRLEPPYSRYRTDGTPCPIKRPEFFDLTTGEILNQARLHALEAQVVMIDGEDVTARTLAVDEEKGTVLLQVEGADPVIRRGKVQVVRKVTE